LNKLKLVRINKKDKDLLLKWRNQATVRENSFTKKKVNKTEHSRWFYKKIKEKNNFWMFKYENKKCGMVRLEKKQKNLEVGYMISEKYQGKRLGVKMLKLFIKKSHKVNIASNLSLSRAGFKKKILNTKKFIYTYSS
jgi:RimJ/RimL family protein N-acetyltransferase